MYDRGKSIIKEMDRAGIQAGVLRVFLENGSWAAAAEAVDDQITRMQRQIGLLRSIKQKIKSHHVTDENN